MFFYMLVLACLNSFTSSLLFVISINRVSHLPFKGENDSPQHVQGFSFFIISSWHLFFWVAHTLQNTFSRQMLHTFLHIQLTGSDNLLENTAYTVDIKGFSNTRRRFIIATLLFLSSILWHNLYNLMETNWNLLGRN